MHKLEQTHQRRESLKNEIRTSKNNINRDFLNFSKQSNPKLFGTADIDID